MVMAPTAAALALLILALPTASGCAARDFIVGGSDGWTTNPAVPHNQWAQRNCFHVNDTLVFRYDKDVDVVLWAVAKLQLSRHPVHQGALTWLRQWLWVSQRHYDACNTTEPLIRLDGGDSRVTFSASGQFFFISADAERCLAGERLTVFVHPWRNKTSPSAPPRPPPKQASPPPPKQATSLPAPPGPSPAQRELRPAPLTAPATGTKNEAGPPSRSSSAVAFRAGVLACFLIGAAAAVV